MGEKIPVLIPASCTVLFVQQTIVSLEAHLYGLTVVKNYAVSDDRDSLLSKYRINV